MEEMLKELSLDNNKKNVTNKIIFNGMDMHLFKHKSNCC